MTAQRCPRCKGRLRKVKGSDIWKCKKCKRKYFKSSRRWSLIE